MNPYSGLSVVYWLHMLATVIWIGSLAALSLLILPVARRTLDARAFSAFLNGIQQRLDPIAWLCLLVLVGTGLFQMSASPNYSGFLAIRGQWAFAILTKHIVFLGMTALSAYITSTPGVCCRLCGGWPYARRAARSCLRRTACSSAS